MLTRFEVKGFKTLVDVGIDLGAVNVFIGANGSGKSNLLEAIGFVGSALNTSLDAEALRYRGIRWTSATSLLSTLKNGPATAIYLSISHGQLAYQASIDQKLGRIPIWLFEDEMIFVDNENVVERVRNRLFIHNTSSQITEHPNYPKTIGIEVDPSKSVNAAIDLVSFIIRKGWERYEGDKVKAPFPLDLRMSEYISFLSEIKDFAIFNPSTPQLRGLLDDVHRNPLGLGGSGLAQALNDMAASDSAMLGPFELVDVFDLIDWADEIGTNVLDNAINSEIPIRLRIGDRFKGEGHKSVSASEASEGALSVLFLLALVGHERSPKMFAVDNFDQALHPRLARELTKLICDQIVADGTRQMFATTHNPLVLDGLDLLDDRIRLFAVDRDEHGATKVERVEVTPKILELADAGMSLSRLWTMGRLGGVPQNF